MAVNTRTEYALRVLIELAHCDGESISAQKICAAQNLPKKYIEHLLALLKNAGLVNSTAGSLGGYSLAKSAQGISFRDILEAVEDRSFQTSCITESPKHCLGKNCALIPFFSELEERLQDIFGSYSLHSIAGLWQKEQS